MNKSKAILLLLFFSLLLINCKKDKRELYGTIHVEGKVVDFISNQPLSNTHVSLWAVRTIKQEPLGYGEISKPVASDTTDDEGNYSFTYEVNGQNRLEVLASPDKPTHVSSFFTLGEEGYITSVGSHQMDIRCHRSAYAKVTVTNTSPIDTPYVISVRSNIDKIVLNNFHRDTIIYLKIVARKDFINDIRFDKEINSVTKKITSAPWDTIPVPFYY